MLNRDMYFSLFLAIIAATAMLVLYQSFEMHDFRDNINYLNTHVTLSETAFSRAFYEFNRGLGASEPIFFLVFFLSSKILPWSVFILLKNFALYFSIFLFLRRISTSSFGFLSSIFVFFLVFSDFYVFVLAVELHKLSIAFSVLFLGLSFLDFRRPILPILFSSIIHFQMILLLPLGLKIKNSVSRNALIVFSIGGVVIGLLSLFIADQLVGGLVYKVSYYWNARSYSLSELKVLVLMLAVIFLFYAQYKRMLPTLLMFLVAFGVFGLMLGFNRILFLLFWGVFYGVLLSQWKWIYKLFVVLPMAGYSLLKISGYLNMVEGI